MQFEKIKYHAKTGVLYKVTNKNPILLNLNNVGTLFGVEEKYNNKIIKWTLNDMNIIKVRDIEENLLKNTKDIGGELITSKLIFKESYNCMLETKINRNSLSGDIIVHAKGDIFSFNDISKKYRYNVELVLNFISIKDKKIFYNFEIVKIEIIK